MFEVAKPQRNAHMARSTEPFRPADFLLPEPCNMCNTSNTQSAPT